MYVNRFIADALSYWVETLGLGCVACDGVPGRTTVRLGWPCTREPNSGEGRAFASGAGCWRLEDLDAWFARPRRSLAKSSAKVLE
jgi:hypothetical protein